MMHVILSCIQSTTCIVASSYIASKDIVLARLDDFVSKSPSSDAKILVPCDNIVDENILRHRPNSTCVHTNSVTIVAAGVVEDEVLRCSFFNKDPFFPVVFAKVRVCR